MLICHCGSGCSTVHVPNAHSVPSNVLGLGDVLVNRIDPFLCESSILSGGQVVNNKNNKDVNLLLLESEKN